MYFSIVFFSVHFCFLVAGLVCGLHFFEFKLLFFVFDFWNWMLVVLIFSVFFVLHFSFFHFAFSFCYALVFEIVPILDSTCWFFSFRHYFLSSQQTVQNHSNIYICLKNKNQLYFFFILVFKLKSFFCDILFFFETWQVIFWDLTSDFFGWTNRCKTKKHCLETNKSFYIWFFGAAGYSYVSVNS